MLIKLQIINYMALLCLSAGMLSDRSYAGAVLAPSSSEKIKSGENGTESGVTE